MGLFGGGNRKDVSTTNVTTNTNTAIRDIGFTGDQALNMAALLENANIVRQQLQYDSMKSYNDWVQSTNDLTVGASVDTSRNIIGASSQTGNYILGATSQAGANIIGQQRAAGQDILYASQDAGANIIGRQQSAGQDILYASQDTGANIIGRQQSAGQDILYANQDTGANILDAVSSAFDGLLRGVTDFLSSASYNTEIAQTAASSAQQSAYELQRQATGAQGPALTPDQNISTISKQITIVVLGLAAIGFLWRSSR
jgi:hypothetical protein